MANLFELEEKAHHLVLREIGPMVRSGERVLEVGCGDCRLLRRVGERYAVRGFGIDPYLVPEESEALRCLPLAAEEISRLTGRFSLVYSVMSLHHFRDVPGFLQDLHQVLGWRGHLLLLDWKEGAETGIPERYFNGREVVQMLEAGGFRVCNLKEIDAHFLIIARPAGQKVAIATSDGVHIHKGMLGQAAFFHIYQFDNNGEVRLVERRKNPFQNTLQHQKTLDVYRVIRDCPLVVSRAVGKKGIGRLRERGIVLRFERGTVAEALENIRREELEKEGG